MDQPAGEAGKDKVTLATLLARIASDHTLSEGRRMTACSAIRCFARAVGQNPETMTVELGSYRRAFANLSPARAGISRTRWRNIKSGILFAFRYAGVPTVPGRSVTPPSDRWTKLLNQLNDHDRKLRYRLSRFARYCTTRKIEPDQVNDAVVSDFHTALETMSFDQNPGRTVTCVIGAWNQAAEVVPRWPKMILSPTRNGRRWTPPFSVYPPALLHELEAWLAHAASWDLLDEEAPRRPVRSGTVLVRRYQIKAFLGALVVCGRDPSSIRSLSDLVQPETAKTGLRYLLERSSGGNCGRVHNTARMLKVLARDWCKVGPEQTAQLAAMCRRLHAGCVVGLTAKNRERLRPFDDPRHVSALLDLPQALLFRAKRVDQGRRHDALEIQVALAIELLLMVPMRIGNLAALNVEEQLSFTRPGRQGKAHLVIPAAEVKNGQALEFELHHETTRLLKIYLEEYRPRLGDGANLRLFPGQNGRHKNARLLGHQISRTIWDQLGLKIHPHLFRHIAAKLFLEANPGSYEVVRRVLGHRSIDTTTTFYTGTETAAAVRYYDEQILALRRAPAARRLGRQ